MKFNHQGTNKITMPGKMRVEVELEAFKKMQCYIDICNEEVGWLGTAYRVGNVITIKDVFLFDQEVHATTCELTPQGLSDFTMGLFNTLPSDDAMEIVNNMALWGHSHVRMGVSPSGQDDAQLREFSNSGYDWFLRVIGNKRGEFEYTYMDYKTGIEVKDLDWEVKIPGLDMTELKKEVKEEVGAKVKRKTYTNLYNPGQQGGYTSSLGVGRSATSHAEQICMNRNGYSNVNDWPDSLLKQEMYDYNPYELYAPIEEDNPYEYVEEEIGGYHSELICVFPIDELDNNTYDVLNNAMEAGLSIEDFANMSELASNCEDDKDKLGLVSYYLERINGDILDKITLSELTEVIEICEGLSIYLNDEVSLEIKEGLGKKGISFNLKGTVVTVDFDKKPSKETNKETNKKPTTGKRRGRPRKSEAEKVKNKKTKTIKA